MLATALVASVADPGTFGSQTPQHMGDFLRRRVADNERHHLEGCQESL